MGLLGATVGARFPGITDAITKLPFFDIGLNDRMVFLAAFSTAALAALGAEWLAEKTVETDESGETEHTAARRRARRVFAVVACVAAAGAVWAMHTSPSASHRFAKLELPEEFFRERLLAQLVPLGAAAAVWLLLPRRRLGAAVAASAVLLAGERFVEEREVYPTYPASAFYPPVEAFRSIPRDAPYRFAAIGFAFVPNISALYELEDVRGYEAMNFKPLVDTHPLWCVPQGVWFNRVDDPTRPFLSFLNVRWVFAAPDWDPPAGWPVLYRGEEGVLVENPRVVPRAFAPRSYWMEPDPARRLARMGTMTDFASEGVLDEVESGGGPAPRRNGEATVDVVEYLPQSMRLAIDAKAPALVATSVTGWPGWKLTVDGRRAPLLGYNHAFLAFRVPPGRHEVRLVYRPDGVVRGAAVSFAALLAAAALWWRPRPRRLLRLGKTPAS
jgi:hypothetical protein